MSSSSCDASAISDAISFPVLAFLVLCLATLSYVYWLKRSELISLYADPRNRIVTFMKPSDFMSETSTSRRRKMSQHRDVLEEVSEQGTTSERSMTNPRSS